MKMLYIGQGDYLLGTPARDLTADEWDALPETTRQAALALDLYQKVEDGDADGREDADVVDDGTPGAADDREGHRGLPRHRGRKTQD